MALLAGMLAREKLLPLVGRMLSPCSSGRKKSSGCGKSWNQSANPVSTIGRRLVADGGPVHVAGDHLQRGVEAQLGEQVVVVLADSLAVRLVVGPDSDVLICRIRFGDQLFRLVHVGAGVELVLLVSGHPGRQDLL